MKKFIRNVFFLLLFVFRWWSISSFQWLQRRHLPPTDVQRPRYRLPSKLQRDENSGANRKTLNVFFFPWILISPIFQSLSLKRADPSNPLDVSNSFEDEEENFANKTQNELLAQAEALRVKAKAIRAEAQAMEVALQETTWKRRLAKLSMVDEIITTLFSSKLSECKVISTTLSNDKDIHTTAGLEVPTPVVVVPDSRVVADRLKSGRYNQNQVLAVVDRLYILQARALGQISLTNTTSVASTPQFPTSHSLIPNETASELYGEYLETLSQAACLLDQGPVLLPDQVYSMAPSDSLPTRTPSKSRTTSVSLGRLELAIRSRIKELRKTDELNRNRLLSTEINRVVSAAENGTVDDYDRQTLGAEENNKVNNAKESDQKDLLYNIATTTETTAVPMWVPSTLLPYIKECNTSTIGRTEVKIIEKQVLSGSRFFMTSSESVPGAALFRGNIRTATGRVAVLDNDKGRTGLDNTTAEVFADVQSRLEAAGLGDKVQLFFMQDLDAEPQMQGTRPAIAAMEEQPKPVLLAISKAVCPDESKIKKNWIQRDGKTACYLLTAVTIFHYSFSMRALNKDFFDALLKRRDLTVLYSCIPMLLGIIFLQTIHEAAHYLIAKKNEIKIGCPIPIPSIHFTSLPHFGCITPLRSFPKNRAALLDFALSGPLTAITASLGLVIGGILLTVRASPFQLARFPVMSVANMKSSFLVGSILSCLAPKIMMLPVAQPVPMHPFFVVGASGLVSNGLNLLPIFRLDGGRACLAAMGQRQGAVISVFSVLLMVSMVMSGAFSIFITWMLLVALLQRRQEIPPRDDVTEVDGTRLILWLLSFLLSASILAPFPGFSSLGI
jgi:Zn-dependent protease